MANYLLIANNVYHSLETEFLITESDINNAVNIEEACQTFNKKGYHPIVLTEQQANDLLPILTSFVCGFRKAYSKRLFVTDEDLLALKQILCIEFNIPSLAVFNSKTRKQDVVVARQLFFTLLRTDKYGSQEKTGKTLKMNHATVLHATKAITNYIETKDPVYYIKIARIARHYLLTKQLGIPNEFD